MLRHTWGTTKELKMNSALKLNRNEQIRVLKSDLKFLKHAEKAKGTLLEFLTHMGKKAGVAFRRHKYLAHKMLTRIIIEILGTNEESVSVSRIKARLLGAGISHRIVERNVYSTLNLLVNTQRLTRPERGHYSRMSSLTGSYGPMGTTVR